MRLTNSAIVMAQGTAWKARQMLGDNTVDIYMVFLPDDMWAAWVVRIEPDCPQGFPGLFAGFGAQPEAALAMLHGRMNVNMQRAAQGRPQVAMMVGAAHRHNMLSNKEWADVE